MLGPAISRLVDFCVRRAWWVVVPVTLAAAFCSVWAVRHFAVTTDTTSLFPPQLPWAERAFAYMRTFPQPDMVVVVAAPTPEAADEASGRLAAALTGQKSVINSVREPQGGAFFADNGLLYLPTSEVARLTGGLAQAAPLLAQLSADPSLRGALGALDDGLAAVEARVLPLDAMTRPLDMAAQTAAAALSGKQPSFSWQELASGAGPQAGPSRRFLEVEPVLDYHALEPGRNASDAILATAHGLHLDEAYRAQVRLTGLVPINDDGFATLAHNAGLNAAVSLSAVGLILWLGLRSARIIAAVVASVVAGLAISAALGLCLVGALNLISVAFLALFIGLGIDFGIQFGVRYRAERHELAGLNAALRSAARKAGPPLALAAAATAVGFGAFVPTDFRGLSELGEIAGAGMLIAFLMSITLLPALISLLKPPPERRPMGYAALAPVDRFLKRHRMAVLVGTATAVAAASPLLLLLRFDFNPLHLQNPKAPAVATFLELRTNPLIGANAIEIMSPDLDVASALAGRLAKLPQVAQARTINTLMPRDQDRKLALIRAAAAKIEPSLHPAEIEAPPSDADTIAALGATAANLERVAGNATGPGAAAARRLATLLERLAKADPAVRSAVATAVSRPLATSLERLRAALHPTPVTLANLPAELKRQWLAPDGRARIQVLPKGDPDDTAVMRGFVTAVMRLAPTATGPAVLLYEAGNTVVRAFAEAGLFAIGAIVLLLAVTLRRVRDVLLTLVPLLVAAVVTLELAVALGIRLNFANIIALPLLLGVGVAFKIYYVMAWRSGRTALVQSTLTRAVVFSALTTGTAFSSLWMSNDPGASSMGELMALALACTMAAAVLFQPALMGPPRRVQLWTLPHPAAEPGIRTRRVSTPRATSARAPAAERRREPTEHKVES